MVRQLIKRSTTHTLMALAEASLIALLVVGLIAGTAFAAKGGKGDGGSTLALVVLDEDGVANYGDQVTFHASTTATDRPFVSLKCYQGSLVYSGSAGLFDAYMWSKTFTLRSSYWTGGAANCDARLYVARSNGRTTTLATMSFVVEE